MYRETTALGAELEEREGGECGKEGKVTGGAEKVGPVEVRGVRVGIGGEPGSGGWRIEGGRNKSKFHALQLSPIKLCMLCGNVCPGWFEV